MDIADWGASANKKYMVLDSDPPLLKDLMRFKPGPMTPNAWAVKAGVSRTVWTDMRRHGNPSRRTLEKLLAAAGSTLAEFEALRLGSENPPPSTNERAPAVTDLRSAAWRSAPLPSIPVVATAMAGGWEAGSAVEQISIDPGNVVGKVDRPISLAGDPAAYALAIVGDSMWPRFRPGRRVIVSPSAPVEIGDDVVVTLRRPDTGVAEKSSPALIKEITRRSAAYIELRQFNPDRIFRVETALIADIQKIVGEAV